MSWDQILSDSWKRKSEKRAMEECPLAGARLGLGRSGFAAPGPISNLYLPTGVSGGQAHSWKGAMPWAQSRASSGAARLAPSAANFCFIIASARLGCF